MTARRLLLPALIVIATFILIMNYFGSRSTSDAVPATAGDSAYQHEEGPDSMALESTVETNEKNRSVISSQSSARQAAPELSSVDNIAPDDDRVNETPESSRANVRAPSSPPEASAPVLSERVFNVIDEAQWLQQSEQWEESLIGLNALYSDFESMNAFEQTTLLNFYTNTLIRMEMWQESISAFTLMLTVPDLRPDINARALMALGQLHERVDETSVATEYYEEWLEFTRDIPGLEDQTVQVEQRLSRLR